MSEKISASIASWNLAKNTKSSTGTVIEQIKRELDVDIVSFPEVDPTDDFTTALDQLGYTNARIIPYQDEVAHSSGEQYLYIASRFSEDTIEQIRLGTRNAGLVHSKQAGLKIVGAHFDDRRETNRLDMTKAFLDSDIPDALIGDLNAMHRDDPKARLLSHPFTRRASETIGKLDHSKAVRLSSLATRLCDMASGDVIDLLKAHDLTDADTKRRATMKLGGRALVQLDHLFTRPNIYVQDFRTHSFPGSDHNAISAMLATK